MQLDSVSLRYFVAIAQHKNFRKAASELHISQPALSRRVRMLEEQLGVELLMRHGRGVTPTQAGELLQERAKAILRMEAGIRFDIQSLNQTLSGHLRIGTPPSFGKLVLGKVLSRFVNEHPSVTWALHEGFSDELQSMLLNDKIDVAILSEERAKHPDLRYWNLYEEALCLISSYKHEPRFGDVVSLAQMSDLSPIIGSPLLLKLVNRQLSKPCVPIVELNVTAPVHDLILGSNLYFIGLRSHFWSELQQREFRYSRMGDLSVVRSLANRADRPMSIVETALFKEIKKAIDDVIAWERSPFIAPRDRMSRLADCGGR